MRIVSGLSSFPESKPARSREKTRAGLFFPAEAPAAPNYFFRPYRPTKLALASVWK